MYVSNEEIADVKVANFKFHPLQVHFNKTKALKSLLLFSKVSEKNRKSVFKELSHSRNVLNDYHFLSNLIL